MNSELSASIHRHMGSIYVTSTLLWHTVTVPVVPHKAVAEVSQKGNYRRGELL